jgi:hypothetical protein
MTGSGVHFLDPDACELCVPPLISSYFACAGRQEQEWARVLGLQSVLLLHDESRHQRSVLAKALNPAVYPWRLQRAADQMEKSG